MKVRDLAISGTFSIAFAQKQILRSAASEKQILRSPNPNRETRLCTLDFFRFDWARAKQKQEQEHGDPQMAFVKKLHDDGLIGISFQRCVALRCRFAGYRCSDNVEKTCVWPGGIYSWPEKSYGLKWVVVHGLESICIAIRRRDLDLELAGPFYRGLSEVRVMYGLSTAIIYEIEDLADELRKSSGQFIEKPFGVVSVNHSHEESGHEASSAEYDDKKAIEFLNEKMKRSCSEYTFEETVQMSDLKKGYVYT